MIRAAGFAGTYPNHNPQRLRATALRAAPGFESIYLVIFHLVSSILDSQNKFP